MKVQFSDYVTAVCTRTLEQANLNSLNAKNPIKLMNTEKYTRSLAYSYHDYRRKITEGGGL